MALPPQYQSRQLPTPARVQSDPGLNPLAIAGRAVGDAGDMLAGAARRRDAAEDRVRELDVQAREEEARTRRTQELAERSAAFEEMQTGLQAEILSLREAGAPDHEARVAQLIEERTGGFLSTVQDREVANHFLAPLARLKGSTSLREQEWSIGQRGKALADNHDAYVAGIANRLSTAMPTAQQLADEIDGAKATIGAYNIPQVAKDALEKDALKRITLGAADNLMRDNPKLLLDSIDAGDFNTILDDKEKPAYRARAEARLAQIESAARAAATSGEALRKEQIRVSIEDANNFVTTDPAALIQAAQWATEAGDLTLAQDAEKAAARAQINAQYLNRSPAEIRAAVRDIEGRKGWRDDRKLVAAREHMVAMAAKLEDRAKDDPVGLFITQGGSAGLPELNLTDPAVMGRYFAAGDAAAKKYGTLPKYIPDDIAEPVRDAFAAAGAADKARTIATLTAYGRTRGAGLMRQIAPAEPGYAALLDLTTMRDRGHGLRLATEALGGWEQAKANPKLIDAAQLTSVVNRNAEALAMLSGPQRAGAVEVAKGLYASRAAKAGATSFNQALFGEALQDALGRAGPTGGIGQAPNGKAMILPRGATQRDVELAMARADGADIMAAAYGGRDAPSWGGKLMTPTQFKRLTPVLVADDNGAAVYAFRSESGFVQSQKRPGENFLLDVRALARLARK